MPNTGLICTKALKDGRPDTPRYLADHLKQIKGPIILVGYSYGGAVVTNAAFGNPNVKALVHIPAFAPAQGDSLAALNARHVAHPIPPVPVIPSTYPKPDGTLGRELTIDPAKYSSVLVGNELPKWEADAFAAEQRPLSIDSAVQASGAPAWATIPSWYMVAKEVRAISPDLERFMAHRARAHTVEVNGRTAPVHVHQQLPTPITSSASRAWLPPPSVQASLTTGTANSRDTTITCAAVPRHSPEGASFSLTSTTYGHQFCC